MARLGAKVAMKGLGRGKKRLQYSIVDLFPDIPTVPDRCGVKHTSFLFKRIPKNPTSKTQRCNVSFWS